MPATEETARFEASLLGGTYVNGWPEIRIGSGRLLSKKGRKPIPYIKLPDGWKLPTDPNTPEGAWEWFALAKLHVGWDSQNKTEQLWCVSSELDWDMEFTVSTPIAAVSAAILKLAAKWTEEQRDD